MRCSVTVCAVLFLCCPAMCQDRSAAVQPGQFEIGRHTFFDFGPPFNFYEIFIVRPSATGTSVERITLTPPVRNVSHPPRSRQLPPRRANRSQSYWAIRILVRFLKRPSGANRNDARGVQFSAVQMLCCRFDAELRHALFGRTFSKKIGSKPHRIHPSTFPGRCRY